MKKPRAYKLVHAGMLVVFLVSVAAGQADPPTSNGVNPYRFERVNEHNFLSQGWREQEVNLIQGQQHFADESEHLSIVCGPDNDSDRRLIKGSVTMNLPTSAFPTLRRIRLRRAGYSGTLLANLTELKYSTYLVRGGPTAMVLQVDINGDETKDFNIFFAPEEQPTNPPPVVLDVWQQWDALHGIWGVEASTIPGFSNGTELTIEALTVLFPSARIIDTPPIGNNGEGVRFTVGPPALYPNNLSYFDALIIGTADRNRSTLFDFKCDSSDQN